jgi:hypothetical protein
MDRIFKRQEQKPDIIEHTVASDAPKALQIEDIERVFHESLLEPFKAVKDILGVLEQQRILLNLLYQDTLTTRQYHDEPASLGLTVDYELKYFNRTYCYCYSNTAFTLKISNGAQQNVPANTWTLINYPQGSHLTVLGGSDTAQINCIIRSCDVPLANASGSFPSVGTPLTPWSGNPTQTAAAAADTVFTFGPNGNTPFNHISIQNNSGAAVTFAIDKDSTAATTPVYVLTTGQLYVADRTGTALHFNTAAQKSFQGAGGITVEAFA